MSKPVRSITSPGMWPKRHKQWPKKILKLITVILGIGAGDERGGRGWDSGMWCGKLWKEIDNHTTGTPVQCLPIRELQEVGMDGWCLVRWPQQRSFRLHRTHKVLIQVGGQDKPSGWGSNGGPPVPTRIWGLESPGCVVSHVTTRLHPSLSYCHLLWR